VRQRTDDRRAAPDALDTWEFDEIIRGRTRAEIERDLGPRAQMVSAREIAPAPTEWLWPGRIPLGTLTLFAGDPKLGKSLAVLSVIAAVSRGGPLPGEGADGPATAPLGSAILLSAEDDPARTIVPRLLASGADLDRVHILSTILEPKFQGFHNGLGAGLVARGRMPTLSGDDLEVIERRAAALGDCRLIVFDPISAYLARGADVRRALAPLGDMAIRLGATVVLITHLSKGGASGTNGKYRVLNSIEYTATCRTNFLFLTDPDDPSGRRRLMLENGRNLGPGQAGLPFVIRDDGAGPFCDWLPETVDLDADAALARTVKVGKSGASDRLGRRHACEEWLRGYLAGGPKPTTECEQAALAAGFNRGLVERARAALAIRSIRSGFGKGAGYHLCLPQADDRPPDCPDVAVDGHAPQFSASESRVEHVEHVEHGGDIRPVPPAGRVPRTGAIPIEDDVV
jgi:hypothetical protein